jgi:hypothetical protein
MSDDYDLAQHPELLELAAEAADPLDDVDETSFAWGMLATLAILAHDPDLVRAAAGAAELPAGVDVGWLPFAFSALWTHLEHAHDRIRRENLDAFLEELLDDGCELD